MRPSLRNIAAWIASHPNAAHAQAVSGLTAEQATAQLLDRMDQAPNAQARDRLFAEAMRYTGVHVSGAAEFEKACTQYLGELDNARTRKTAATMGGGSITNTDQQLAKLAGRVVQALPGVGGYAKRITEHNVESVERQMARLLQSPGELGDTLRALPPDRRRAGFDEALRASGLAGAGATTP